MGNLIADGEQKVHNTVVDEYGRIVDFVNAEGEAWEVKSGQYVYKSSQIMDFLKNYGGKFNLVINKTTRYSAPLLEGIREAGAKIYRFSEEALVEVTEGATSTLECVPIIVVIPNDFLEEFIYGDCPVS